MGKITETLKQNRRKIAAALTVTMVAASLNTGVVPTNAAQPGFSISSAWINSPTTDTSTGFPSKTDYTWTADTEETRNVSFGIRYAFNDSMNSKGFDPGDVRIHVSGLKSAYRNEPKEAAYTVPDSIWEMEYDESNDIYTFVNHTRIDALTGFAGEMTLSYEMNSRELSTMQQIPVQVTADVLGESYEADEIWFNFDSIRDTYELSAVVKTVANGSDLFGRDDLNIARYEITETIKSASRAAYDKHYLITDLNDGVLLGYSDGASIQEDMELLGDGSYRIPYAPAMQIYIGYPKDKMDTAEHTFILTGSYYDEDMEEDLAYAETSVNIRDFSFTYDGELYMIGKTGYDTKPEENRIPIQKLQNGYTAKYSLSATARYADPVTGIAADLATPSSATYALATPSKASKASKATPSSAEAMDEEDEELDGYIGDGMILAESGTGMDVWIIDDFIYIQNKAGEFKQLPETDYDMKSLTIPDCDAFTNEDGLSFESGKYTAEILVNTFDRNDAAFKTVKIDKNEHKIALPANTKRVMIRIRGLEETLSLEHGSMWLEVEYHLDPSLDIQPGGYIRNLDSIWADWCGIEHHNAVDPDVSYPGDDDDTIKSTDMNTYGYYMQRNFFDYWYVDRGIQGLVMVGQKQPNFDANDPDYGEINDARTDSFILTEDGYETLVDFTAFFTNVYDGAQRWSLYTILPEGMEINHDQKLQVGMVSPKVSMSLKNIKISEQPNYKGSGRTYVSMTFEFPKGTIAPANGLVASNVRVPVRIPYEAAAKTTSYPVWAVSMMKSPDTEVTPTGALEGNPTYAGQAKGGVDDGSAIAAAGSAEAKLWADIDRDGDSKEKFVYNSMPLTIKELAGVHMDLISYVQAEDSEFLPNINEDHEMTEVRALLDGQYTYRLNAVNTGSMAKNVVFYDVLENSVLDGKPGAWKGTLEEVDTSLLQAKGLNPKVYYSTNPNPALDYKNAAWTTTMPANKASIKAVAVVADTGTKHFVLNENLYVDVVMKAPALAQAKEQSLDGTHTLNHYQLAYDSLTGPETLVSNITGVTIYETGSLTIVKKDADTGAELNGAVFYLEYADPDLGVAVPAFTVDGSYTVEGLEYGEYRLVELTPPTGYEKLSDEENRIPVYVGADETRVGADGKDHLFQREQTIEVKNEKAEDFELKITKTTQDDEGGEVYGPISFVYRVEGNDLSGEHHVWNCIITPEDGYGEAILTGLPMADENGYKVTEMTSSRYQIKSLTGTNCKDDADLSKKSITADLHNNHKAQADYVNSLKRWDKFSWSSSVVNHIKK